MREIPSEARDIGRFVRARRRATDAGVYPELPTRRRHQPHLTQGDLAELTNVSTVVISQIEVGTYPNLNKTLLQRISQALRLNRQQQIYLFGLFEPREHNQLTGQSAPDWLEESIRSMTHPVLILDPGYGIVTMNQSAQTLTANLGNGLKPGNNIVAAVFELPEMRSLAVDWQSFATGVISGIKMSYAMFPNYRNYIDDLARKLESRNELFKTLWNQDDPLKTPGIEIQFNHPELGTLNVYQVLTDILEAPGLTRVEFIAADENTLRKLTRP